MKNVFLDSFISMIYMLQNVFSSNLLSLFKYMFLMCSDLEAIISFHKIVAEIYFLKIVYSRPHFMLPDWEIVVAWLSKSIPSCQNHTEVRETLCCRLSCLRVERVLRALKFVV